MLDLEENKLESLPQEIGMYQLDFKFLYKQTSLCKQGKVLSNVLLTYIRQIDLPIIITWMSSLSILGVLEVILSFFHFSMKLLLANSIAPDGTPRFENNLKTIILNNSIFAVLKNSAYYMGVFVMRSL